MKTIIDGRVINLPNSVKENQIIEQWQNCIYVIDSLTGLGRIYYKGKDKWIRIASKVRNYNVNEGYCMPYCSKKRHFVFFTTKDSNLTSLLNCVTGKYIYKGSFEVDLSVMFGISENPEDSCFILKTYRNNSIMYVVIDSNGNGLIQHNHGKLSFLSQNNFGGIWPILFDNGKCKGVFHFFKGKTFDVIPAQAGRISICSNAVVDNKGKLHYPVIKVTGGEKTKLFDFNGKVIHEQEQERYTDSSFIDIG